VLARYAGSPSEAAEPGRSGRSGQLHGAWQSLRCYGQLQERRAGRRVDDGQDRSSVRGVSSERRCVVAGYRDAEPVPGLEPNGRRIKRHLNRDLLAGRERFGIGATKGPAWPGVLVWQNGSTRHPVRQPQDTLGEITDAAIGSDILEVDVQRTV